MPRAAPRVPPRAPQDKDWIVAVAAIRWRRFRAVFQASQALRARARRRRKVTATGSTSHPDHRLAAAAAQAAAAVRRCSSEPLERSASSEGGGGSAGGRGRAFKSDGGPKRPEQLLAYTGAAAERSVTNSDQAAPQGLLQNAAAAAAVACGAAGAWDVDGEALWDEVMQAVWLPRLRRRAVYEVRTHLGCPITSESVSSTAITTRQHVGIFHPSSQTDLEIKDSSLIDKLHLPTSTPHNPHLYHNHNVHDPMF